MRYSIVGRQKIGQSQLQITRDLNIKPNIVFNLWKHFKDTVSKVRQPGRRSRATTAFEDRYLSITVMRNGSAAASQLARDLKSTIGSRI
ncbi:hypothetical protein AVEN_221486-1 [Araneus ventricosus]|uniref:Uncharacterized protein n=1 Tax=Araneus ventricosus TaxID=182803 RepID=A0A4Y2E3F7_ARAVE|nr:hypothetical protein AVEN_221486-1 [Araneus ventricosus]